MLHEFAARGSIARTAEALGYTPSAVSQQLAVLEKEAGTPLLDRTARSAGLTDAGKRLAIHAERILAMVEAAEADLSAQAAQPSGRVVVTAFPSAAVAFAPALARSLREHPHLSLLLREAEPDEGLQLVRSGEAEVAIVDDWTGRMSADLEAADAGLEDDVEDGERGERGRDRQDLAEPAHRARPSPSRPCRECPRDGRAGSESGCRTQPHRDRWNTPSR